MAQKRALAAVKALGDGISPAAAAAYALGFTAGAVSSHLEIICWTVITSPLRFQWHYKISETSLGRKRLCMKKGFLSCYICVLSCTHASDWLHWKCAPRVRPPPHPRVWWIGAGSQSSERSHTLCSSFFCFHFCVPGAVVEKTLKRCSSSGRSLREGKKRSGLWLMSVILFWCFVLVRMICILTLFEAL